MRRGESRKHSSIDRKRVVESKRESWRETEVEQCLCDFARTLLSDPVSLRKEDAVCSVPLRPSRDLVWSSSADWLPCWSCG